MPGPSQVALWQWSLLASLGRQAALWDTLSTDEQARAERFHFPRDCRRYVVGRGTLRARLAAYLGCPAAAVALSCNEFSKPALQDPYWHAQLSFNLSHSDEMAVGAELSHPPGSFAVSVHPALPARLLRIDGDPAEIAHWTLAALSVSPGYAAAIALRQPDCTFAWRAAMRS